MNAWVQITSGRGPDECCLAVAELLPVFVQDAQAAQIQVELLESVEGPKPRTYRSLLLTLEGEGLSPFLQSWEGTVQWVQRSPYRPNHGRKNWFVAVSAFHPPRPEDRIAESDIRYEAIRASGPGGQHVNKTSSAIRATHLPTGTVATAQEERSQLMNKKLAAARLVQLLRDRHAQSRQALEQEVWHQHNCLERGNAVRTYTGSPPRRVLK